MVRHYSTLELVRYDDTARAPERDYNATAFELDGAALAPQVNKKYNVAVLRVSTNHEYRLYLTKHHKWFTIARFLRPRVRISLLKNALLVFPSPNPRSNGRG